MDNYYAGKLIGLIAESGVAIVPNPLINITLQGRADTYPKRRGLTRVPELLAAGVRVGYGQDCVLDPWYPLGTADMLAQMADRCYLEKCRDRLYAEFVLGGIATTRSRDGVATMYGSGLDLLRKTPGFIDNTLDGRLEG